ncbi:MAG: hypothetical protein A3F83_11415 [Candidatus Glassbacteria bacterium RIFCSPLOWO2_12_FULL_58_11]|uniref:Uncharacterized protein n=1 Tax=Candidatus Glassbacteria bacterium RIFCSPLOWO2_12_FULL_58_11 TaxID=1817867 RepID=A0A1F5Z027_9BACT|nr:MAG: hypothetical protein A3F83_11415 [Candidatus Glassbacteria bacterium RIFCSPLOWO2_12_FULL_58_11]
MHNLENYDPIYISGMSGRINIMLKKRSIIKLMVVLSMAFSSICGTGNDYGGGCTPTEPFAGRDTVMIDIESTGSIENRTDSVESFSIVYLYEAGGKSMERNIAVGPDSVSTVLITYSMTVVFEAYQGVKDVLDPVKIYILKSNKKILLGDITCRVIADKSTKRGEGTFPFIYYGNYPGSSL